MKAHPINKGIAEILRRRAAQTAKSLRWNAGSLMLACLGLAATVVVELKYENTVLTAVVAASGLTIVWAFGAWQAKKLEEESFDAEMRIVARMLSRKPEDRQDAVAGPAPENLLRPTLSRREIQVLQEAALGKSNKEIASALCIGQQTVKNHLGHIFQKLDVTDRTVAVLVAFGNGWLETEAPAAPR